MAGCRVMQITHDLRIGGLQRVVVDLAGSLDGRGYDVTVCALKGGGDFDRELEARGIRIIRLPAVPGRTDYLSFGRLAKILRRERPAIIHTHNTQPLLEGTLAAIMARVPVRIHTDHARLFPDKLRYMRAERIATKFTSQVVAVSRHTKDQLTRYEGIPRERILVVPNGIIRPRLLTADEKRRKRAELGLEDHGPLDRCGGNNTG